VQLSESEIIKCSKGFPLKFKKFDSATRKASRRQRSWARTKETREGRLRPLKLDKLDHFKSVTFPAQKEAFLRLKEAWARILPSPPVPPHKSFPITSVPVKPNMAPKIKKTPVDVVVVPYDGPADLVGSIVGKKWAI
jgi:hypothetical protein